MDDQIFKLKLHEKMTLGDGTEIMRVPGGWIYKQYTLVQTVIPDGGLFDNEIPTSVFVRFTLD